MIEAPARADALVAPQPRWGRVWLRLALRAGALLLLVALYYASEWTPLRRLTRALVSAFLPLLGHAPAAFDTGTELALAVDGGEVLFVTPACTYLDLWLLSAALTWRFGRPILRNAASLAALAGAVLLVNLVRIVAALHLAAEGFPWEIVHHAADVAIHTVWIASFVLFAARADAAR